MDQVTLNKLLGAALEHHQSGRLADAEAIYRKVLAQQPRNVDALHLQGLVELSRGRADIALYMIQQAVQILPNFTAALRSLGQVLMALGRQTDGLAAYNRAVQIDPRDIGALVDLAGAFVALNRHADAVPALRRATELQPNNSLNLANYGYVLGRVGQVEPALAALRRAIEIDPKFGPAWMQLAETLWRAGRYPESVEPARQAVELMPENPQAHLIYGNTLQVAGEFEETAAEYRRVIELMPESFDAHNNLALTTLKMGDAREAARMYEEVRRRWPNENDALANQSLTLLTLGDLENGLAHYEARVTMSALEGWRRLGKLWDGRTDLKGKTILLASEQGFGDTIHFIRYAALAAERGATVLAGSPLDLASLVATVPGVSRVMPVGSAMPQLDLVAAMGSLPKLFGTTLETIPANVPYMSADPARVEQWRQKLAADANVKVGIAWAGSPAHQNDRARSARLDDFSALARFANVTFYSLQKGPPARELQNPPAGMNIVALGDELKDFGDTAALLMNLDLLISVDTSVVHLAGALARPVWTLIARGPDWRWMIDREDTPWYPTMRLFRQQQRKVWRPVLERIADALRSFVAQSKR